MVEGVELEVEVEQAKSDTSGTLIDIYFKYFKSIWRRISCMPR